MKTNVILIKAYLDNEENMNYIKELNLIDTIQLRISEDVDEAIKYMKHIEFKENEIKIILSIKIYSEFEKKFQENIRDKRKAPKILILTQNKNESKEINKDSIKNEFHFDKIIVTTFKDIIMHFILNEDKKHSYTNSDDVQLTFEYIDSIEKLVLPMFFNMLIELKSINNLEKYINILYKEFSKEKEELKELLNSVEGKSNIPIEALCKYFIKLYITDSNFHKKMNEDLGLNKTKDYVTYFKILYEGIKLKLLPLLSNNILYRGSIISNAEIDKIKVFIKNKKEGLPSSIVFSKSFLSFTKEKNIAESSLKNNDNEFDSSNVLFILEKYENMEGDINAVDIEKIIYDHNEKEVLFFPFSPFEVKDIQFINNRYEIKLSYLSKYLRDIDNYKNENTIPNCEFKKQLSDFGLIEKEAFNNINTKLLYNKYKNYNENNNSIIGEIYINIKDVGKDIQIINSNDENKKEREENIEIKINGKKIGFSFRHRFEKEGIYEIKYLFKYKLSNFNFMFYKCRYLTNLNLSNLNNQNIIDMFSMFSNCHNLSNINLSNFNTKNVTNMREMFFNCFSLTNLDLSNFNTQKATDMSYMFSGCYSLTNLDLSNFDTKNVTNMSGMFSGCNSLTDLNINNFNTQNVINMDCMFWDCQLLKNINLLNFNTEKVKGMHGMFCCCKSLTTLNLSNFGTSNVTNMEFLFRDCFSLKTLNISNFTTQTVKSISGMFSGCNSLTSLNLSKFNTQNVINMSSMFSNCHSLTSLDLSNFNTDNVNNMGAMFYNCNCLTYLDISNFNTQNVTSVVAMFSECKSLKKEKIITKDAQILKILE